MTKILIFALLALSFTTGFTCSKNSPPEVNETPAAPSQEQMAAPQDASPATTIPGDATAPTKAPAENK